MDYLIDPFTFAFMQRALAEVLIIGALCGLVGSFVVLRGLAFIGDALIHAVFPGVIIAFLLGYNIMVGAFIFGALTALGIGILSRNRRIADDTAVGVIFAAFFALGIVLVSRQPGFRQDLTSLLFGNILGISRTDVILTALVGICLALIVLVLLKEFVLISFDSNLAYSAGYPVFAMELLLLLIITTTVVVSLQAIGNLLILALLITPAAAARLLTDRLDRMIALSIFIAMASGIAGLYISFYADTSASGTIALVATAVFGIALIVAPQHGWLVQKINARRGIHHEHHYHGEHEDAEIS